MDDDEESRGEKDGDVHAENDDGDELMNDLALTAVVDVDVEEDEDDNEEKEEETEAEGRSESITNAPS